MMRTLKIASRWMFALLLALVASFFIYRNLGLLDPAASLEKLVMQIAAWPLIIWTAVFTLFFSVQAVRADAREQRQRAEQRQVDKKETEEEQRLAEKRTHDEFAIALVGAQLVTGLFDRTKPLPYYMNPMLEQLKPYGKKPKGVYAHAVNFLDDEKQPTFERRYVIFLNRITDNLTWPFRFPALHKQYLYRGLGRMWGEPQQRIPQFITLPKEFEIKEPERVATIEKGLDDPAIPAGLSDEEKSPLDPPAWRWLWRYAGHLSAYTNYVVEDSFNEMHLQFAHAGGYDSLRNAFEHIEKYPPAINEHPMVWTVAVDAPQFVKALTDENANDAGTLLMWAHPQANTGRKPLVFLRRPLSVKAPNNEMLSSAQVSEAISAALKQAGVGVDQLGYLVTDFGIVKPGDDYATQIGNALAQQASEQQHAIDLVLNRTDLTASLEDIGANTAGFSALCAAWAAFSKNKPSLLVGRPAPNRIDVLVFLPRPDHVPPPPDKAYYGAVAEPEFSRPWWGERLDGEPDFGDEPNKERADGMGLVMPAEPFEFSWR